MILKTCTGCGKEFLRKNSHNNSNSKIGQINAFCSRECSSRYRIDREEFTCDECGTMFTRTPANTRFKKQFCSRSCATSNRNRERTGSAHPNWKNGKESYRYRALKHYGPVCSNKNCIITVNIHSSMLDVHHVDGKRENNTIENLRVLCVWCHALITRKKKSKHVSLRN